MAVPLFVVVFGGDCCSLGLLQEHGLANRLDGGALQERFEGQCELGQKEVAGVAIFWLELILFMLLSGFDGSVAAVVVELLTVDDRFIDRPTLETSLEMISENALELGGTGSDVSFLLALFTSDILLHCRCR